MRRGYSTLTLLVVFVALGLYVYFVELERPPASEVPPNESLVDVPSEDFAQLTITTNGQETILAQSEDGNEWRLTGPVTAVADETQVSSITSALSTLQIQRVVAEDVVDFAPFGLDAPTVAVDFVAASGSPSERLLIGDSTPTGGERYAMLADSVQVAAESSVTVTGTVTAMSESVAAAWVESGRISEGDGLAAGFMTHFIAAEQVDAN